MASQPVLQTRQGLGCEPSRVDGGKLADEGEDCHVGKAALGATKLRALIQRIFEQVQDFERRRAMFQRIRVKPARIFVAIEIVLEWAVIGLD